MLQGLIISAYQGQHLAQGFVGGDAFLAGIHLRTQVVSRFQGALWDLFAAPDAGIGLAEADTLVCRCESVTLGRVMELVRDGAPQTLTLGAPQ